MTKIKFLSVAPIILILLTSVSAQTPGPPAGGSDRNLRDSASDLKGRSNEMERMKRDAEKPNPPHANPKPNFVEIKEDFERIQIVNGEIQSDANETPNYERISKATEEIEKRATRLKGNLFPPQSEKNSKVNKKENEQRELKSLLIQLDNAITSFTRNPMFQQVKVVDSKDSKNAQETLEKIIRLSATILSTCKAQL